MSDDDELYSRSELRTIRKAMNQRWPIKPDYKEFLVKKLMQQMQRSDLSPSQFNALAKTLMKAEQQNQSDEQFEARQPLDDRILEIAAEVSAAASAQPAIEGRAVRSRNVTEAEGSSEEPLPEDDGAGGGTTGPDDPASEGPGSAG